MRVVVVGAGIAGLTLALALRSSAPPREYRAVGVIALRAGAMLAGLALL